MNPAIPLASLSFSFVKFKYNYIKIVPIYDSSGFVSLSTYLFLTHPSVCVFACKSPEMMFT